MVANPEEAKSPNSERTDFLCVSSDEICFVEQSLNLNQTELRVPTMKKVFLLLSCCAFVAACNSNSTTNEGAVESSSADSSSAANMSAATRQPDADTSSLNIGTDRTAGTGVNAHANGEKLIAQSDCTGCHRIDQKLVGPAYEAVAQKYENNDKDTDYLAGKIIQGGKGVWGEIPMTPHPNLSQEDAKQMAQYILSLKK